MTIDLPPTERAVTELPQRLIDNVERVVRGKREAVTLCVAAFLARGHVLLEDVPGTGKTTLARALARSLDASFQRVQFTSDLLPADVLGFSVWSEPERSFRFQPGPIFVHVLLADELNRTTPRTQSGLLEAMNTGAVSIDGATRPLPSPFLVLATQNPLEFEGTYPLPESQLDRFLIRLRLGYPERTEERELLMSDTGTDRLETLQPVASLGEVRRLSSMVAGVHVDGSLLDWTVDLARATREHNELTLGVSTRGTLAWMRIAKAMAIVEGRDFVVPDDLKRTALPALAHRVVPFEAGADAELTERVLLGLLEANPTPA